MAVGDIKAGSAFVTFSADLTQFQKDTLKVTRSMDSIGRKAQQVGRSMIIMGTAATAAFTAAVRAGIAFENEMANTLAITGATTAEFTRLNDTARELGRTTTFTATEAARGMKLLSKAGFDTNEVIATIPSTLALARVGALELGQASDIIAGVSKAFGLAADEAGRVADVIGVVSVTSATNVEGLGESLKFVSANASLLGLTVEQTSVALGLLGDRMLRGGIAGRNLSRALERLASSRVQDKLSKLGIEVLDPLTKGLKDPIELFKELGDAIKDLDRTEQSQIFQDLFGTLGGRAALVIARATTDQIDKLRRKVDNANGSIARMQKIIEDTLGGGFKLLTSAVTDFGITIKEVLDDQLRDFAADLKEVATVAAGFAKNNPNLIKSIAAIGVATLGAGVAFTGLGLTLTAFSAGLEALVVITAPLTIAITALAGSLILLIDSLSGGNIGFVNFIRDIDIGFLTLGDRIDATTAKLLSFVTVGATSKLFSQAANEIVAEGKTRNEDRGKPVNRKASFDAALAEFSKEGISVSDNGVKTLQTGLSKEFKKLGRVDRIRAIIAGRRQLVQSRKDVFTGRGTQGQLGLTGSTGLKQAQNLQSLILELKAGNKFQQDLAKTFDLSKFILKSSTGEDKTAKELLLKEAQKDKLKKEINELAGTIQEASGKIKKTSDAFSAIAFADLQSDINQSFKEDLTPSVSRAFNDLAIGNIGKASKRAPTDPLSVADSRARIEDLKARRKRRIAKIVEGGGDDKKVAAFLQSDIAKKTNDEIKNLNKNIKNQEGDIAKPRSVIQGSFSGLAARGNAQLPMVKEQKETNRLLQEAVDAILAQPKGLA